MAGYRSPLAFWVGGAAASPAPDAPAGKRSLLAPWLGGASAPAPSPAGGGYRSLHAFWLGGACAATGTPPKPPAIGGGFFVLPHDLQQALADQLIDEDDVLLLIVASQLARRLQ